MSNKCTCHERDGSYTCAACKKDGYFGHMEEHLELEYRRDKAKEFNEGVAKYRSELIKDPNFSPSCIGALACEYCGEINHGTCLCMGFFTCSECEKKNDIWKVPKMPINPSSDYVYNMGAQWYIDHSPQQLLLEANIRVALLDQLIAEAKEIIDDEDGADLLFDFVLGVAGIDGDPEYQ